MNIKRLIILGGVFIIGLFGLVWFYSHGYIEVAADAKSAGYKLVIIDQKTGKKTELTPKEKVVKRFVKRGSYEVLVQESERSYMSVVKTSGFLRTSSVDVKLADENSRKYVGDSPGPCMFYPGSVLYSFGCDDTFDQAVIHTPATTTQPTMTQKNIGALSGYIEGFIQTKQGNLVLVRSPDADEEEGGPQNIFSLENDSWTITGGYVLSKLKAETTYKIAPYKDGFLVYGSDDEIYYYANIQDQGSAIVLSDPMTKGVNFSEISTYNNQLAALYNTNNSGDDAGEETNASGKSEVIFRQEGQEPINYAFNNNFISSSLCGDHVVCLFNSNGMFAYSLDGPKAKLLYQVRAATWAKEINKQLYIATDAGIVRLDPRTLTGSISYTYGDHENCGIQEYKDGYVVCLINKRFERFTLAVDVNQVNTTSIDKKVAKLAELPEVKKISVYDRFLFISPELGELVYDEAQASFTYDAVAKDRTNSAIQKAVDAQKIDRNVYQIINTLN